MPLKRLLRRSWTARRKQTKFYPPVGRARAHQAPTLRLKPTVAHRGLLGGLLVRYLWTENQRLVVQLFLRWNTDFKTRTAQLPQLTIGAACADLCDIAVYFVFCCFNACWGLEFRKCAKQIWSCHSCTFAYLYAFGSPLCMRAAHICSERFY